MSQPEMYDSYSADQAANEGYAEIDGEKLLIGKYTVEIRNAYMYYRIQRYLIDHPGSTEAQAGRAARGAWRRKAAQSMKGVE